MTIIDNVIAYEFNILLIIILECTATYMFKRSIMKQCTVLH